MFNDIKSSYDKTAEGMLSENEVLDNAFSDFDEEIPPQRIEIAKKCVEETYKSYSV